MALRITSITFVGFAVPLGLAQLLLADHEGPLDRRDWFGLAAGLAAILCSSVAIPMVFVVGIVMLVKRGWRLALFHVLPPAIAFSIWYASLGRSNVGPGHPTQLRPLPQALHFALVLVEGTFEAITRTHGVGAVLLALFLVGLYLVLRRAGPERRRQAVVPYAMLVGALVFAFETGLGRADILRRGASAIRGGHYMDVVAYLVLPSVAFVAEELIRRWRLIAGILVVFFLIAVPANARCARRQEANNPRAAYFRDTIVAIPRLALAKKVPRSEHPYATIAAPITVGWLLDAHALEDSTAASPEPEHSGRRKAASLARAQTQPDDAVSCATRWGDAAGSGGSRSEISRSGDMGRRRHQRHSCRVPLPDIAAAAEWQLINVGLPLTLRLGPGPFKVPAFMLCK